MPHSVFTVVSTVRPQAMPSLRRILHEIEADHRCNRHLPFSKLPMVHFASFTIFTDPKLSPLLVFENNVDGAIEDYIEALIAAGLDGLVRIYQCCDDSPVDPDANQMRQYLRTHVNEPHLYHVGTPYRTAATIVGDLELRGVLEQQADCLAKSSVEQSSSSIWQQLQDAVHAPRSPVRDWFAMVSGGAVTGWRPYPEPRWPSRCLNWSILALLAAGAFLAATWLNALLWDRPLRLTAGWVLVFFVHGAWTSVLLGWPARSRWRDPVNICIWFAAAGWMVSVMPSVGRLMGIRLPGSWTGPFLLGILTVVTLAMLVGRWNLPTPDLNHPQGECGGLAKVVAQEDIDVQNHMSAMVQLRPGRWRVVALKLLLWSLNRTWYPTVLRDIQKGKLFGLSTVHFAQWVVLDHGRYMFLSNYDHSWERYLDDFGTIAFGLARLWGQADRSPGLGNLNRFKHFARTWMVPYSVWYRAYPAVSVVQIWNNEQIRWGLLARANGDESRALLRRLVAAEESS